MSRIFIGGIGPGDHRFFIPALTDAIEKSDCIVGYKTYIELLGNLTEGKSVFSNGMREEKIRAAYAIEKAREGRITLVISSGDPGIYGMAGLILEMMDNKDIETIPVDIIPGVTAASSCASLLGAPLMNDFAVVSLSDLLTERTLIEKRIKLAAEGDFVIAIYNPKSKKRIDLLEKSRRIILEYRKENTPVGIVREAGREKEMVYFTNLKNLPAFYKDIQMGTTLIIGNSGTYIKGKYMITPRGYRL